MKQIVLLLATVCSAFFSNAQLQQNSLSLDGTDDYVSCPLPPVFTDIAHNDFTFEAWIKRQGSVANRVFFAQQDNSNYATILISYALIFYVKAEDVTYTFYSMDGMPAEGQWAHIAATWDASELQPSIYVNGVLQSSLPGGSTSAGINNAMTLGSRTDGAQLFMGEMDEVRIWNTARKECEIISMMYSVPAGDEPDLVTYYNFNRGTAGQSNAPFTSLPDPVGSINGTLVNFALDGETSNWVSSGAPLSATGAQNAYETTDEAAICEGDTYVFGTQSLTETGTYQETFPSVEGCDSLVVLQLTVRTVHMPPVVQAACISYFWEQTGETYSTSGIYTDTLMGSYGCDSILTLDLTIHQPTTSSLQIDACGSYFWGQTGETYVIGGTYLDTIQNAAGCDSIITLLLTIHQLPEGTIIHDGQGILSVNTFASVVEWINCSTGQTIPEQQGQSTFTLTENGSYAVILENAMTLCRDTSDCFTVGFVDIPEHHLVELNIAPNPAHDQVTLIFSGETASLTVLDAQGKQVLAQTIETGMQIPLVTLESGIYFFQLHTIYGTATQKMVKQ